MPDFLISLNPALAPERLLALLQQPYQPKVPPGHCLAFPWGGVALLADRLAKNQNQVQANGFTFAWVGELLPGSDREGLAARLSGLDPFRLQESLRSSGLLDALNGAFAAFVAGPNFLAVITDPMASVQVYVGKDSAGRPVAFGTHADLVARLAGDAYQIDPVSVAEFLNTGIACCPHTMHRNVMELGPGTVSLLAFAKGAPPAGSEFRYWLPPEETRSPAGQRALVAEFVTRWSRAVRARCQGSKLAVQLSGGMDSRLVLAAIPPELNCVGVTLCDSMNREARSARRVARCYQREWIPLERDPEYLGRTAMAAIRFVGCEGEWHHGHTLGFADRLDALGVESVFTGLLMDNNFKGYYARDYVRVSRGGGLLPAAYRRRPFEYADDVSSFCRQSLHSACVSGIVERRRKFAAGHFALQRESACEWLDGYPYSQACDNTGWVIERRVMPLRLPLMDRSLLDLAFRVPMSFKAGGRFFDEAIVQVLGPGASIPSANDGVRPGSGHVGRLLQRGVRKLENNGRKTLSRLGVRLAVPHSWHDFQRYLNESPVLGALITNHGHRLREFEDSVFTADPVQLFRHPDVPWNTAYRLIQLATWRSILDEYHL